MFPPLCEVVLESTFARAGERERPPQHWCATYGKTRLSKRPFREHYAGRLLEHLIEPLDRRVCVILGFELNFGVLPVAAVDSDQGLIGAHQGFHCP